MEGAGAENPLEHEGRQTAVVSPPSVHFVDESVLSAGPPGSSGKPRDRRARGLWLWGREEGLRVRDSALEVVGPRAQAVAARGCVAIR